MAKYEKALGHCTHPSCTRTAMRKGRKVLLDCRGWCDCCYRRDLRARTPIFGQVEEPLEALKPSLFVEPEATPLVTELLTLEVIAEVVNRPEVIRTMRKLTNSILLETAFDPRSGDKIQRLTLYNVELAALFEPRRNS